MAGFQRSVEIDRSPHEVFAVLTDFRNAPQLVQGVEKAEVQGDGVARKGAVVRETRTLMGRTETFDLTIEEFDAPRRIAISATQGKGRFVYDYRLEPLDEGARTRLTLDARGEAKGLLAKLFLPLGMAMMKKFDGDQLERVKAFVERN